MPSTLLNDYIRRIHGSGHKLALAITGGGSLAISELLQVPGGSRTVLEAIVPYSAPSLVQYLGARPEHFCSPRTARAMAMAAYWRAVELSSPENETPTDPDMLLGIGCTASLASDRQKQGPHRLHVALQSAACTSTASLKLTKGARSRAQEELVAARLILNQLAAACGLDELLDLELVGHEVVQVERTEAPHDWRELLLGQVDAVCVEAEDASPPDSCGIAAPLPEDESPAPLAILSGAFNPLHNGHRQMAEIAAEMLGVPVEFEISIENVDKPPLDYTEIAWRVAQFAPAQPVWLTRAATFEDKSAIFPGAAFIVGADTIVRIGDPKYCRGDEIAWRRSVAAIAERGCRFLVFGRRLGSTYQSLEDLQLPPELLKICQGVPESLFREDTSSTELRRRQDEG